MQIRFSFPVISSHYSFCINIWALWFSFTSTSLLVFLDVSSILHIPFMALLSCDFPLANQDGFIMLQTVLFLNISTMISIHDYAVLFAVPLKGPGVKLSGQPGHNGVVLVWEEIPEASRRGFITNYTIFYQSGTTVHSMYSLHNILNIFARLQLSI